jgi:hypothetical protein
MSKAFVGKNNMDSIITFFNNTILKKLIVNSNPSNYIN